MNSFTEREYNEVIEHLDSARHHMRRLMSVSQDPVAKIMVESGYEDIEEICRDFARCHCGMRKPRKMSKCSA